MSILTKLAEEVEKKNPFGGDKPTEDKGAEEKPEDGKEPKEVEEQPAEEQQTAGSVDPLAIMDFFAQPGKIDDAAFHAFCEQNGLDVHQAEGIAYALAQKFMQFLRGGPGAGVDPNSIDPAVLDAGMQAEAQSYQCPVIQKKIALDNLAKDPGAYSAPAEPVEGELLVDPNEQPIDEKTAALLMKIARKL